MTEQPQRDLTEEEKEKILAEKEKFLAEKEVAEALAKKTFAEAYSAELASAKLEMEVDTLKTKFVRDIASDDFNDHTYRFLDQVSDTSVIACIKKLDTWHRIDPECDITIIFDSPGGGVMEGMHLFDHITSLRQKGHHITTMARGYAASMAGILLQSGDRRVMGPEAYIMIHEVSFGIRGKLADVKDEVAFVEKIQDRVSTIFANRCQSASDSTATKKLTKKQIKIKWKKTDWWISSEEALAYGLVDEIR